MDLKETFARNVRLTRTKKRWSQEELGERSGLTRNYIGMIERSETSASIDAIEAVADALGVLASDLLKK